MSAIPPVNQTGMVFETSENGPTMAVNNIVSAFQSELNSIKFDPTSLLSMSPSQLLGMTNVMQRIGTVVGGAFELQVNQIADAIKGLIAPYNELPQDDIQSWVKGQTSFPDYQSGKPVASFPEAIQAINASGANLSSEMSKVTFNSSQVITLFQGTLDSVIMQLNSTGYGDEQSYALQLAGQMELINDMGAQFQGSLSSIITAVQRDVSAWAMTYHTVINGHSQGIENYKQLTQDLQSLTTQYSQISYLKDHPLLQSNPLPPPIS